MQVPTVNVRDAMSTTNSKVVGQLKQGELVLVLEQFVSTRQFAMPNPSVRFVPRAIGFGTRAGFLPSSRSRKDKRGLL